MKADVYVFPDSGEPVRHDFSVPKKGTFEFPVMPSVGDTVTILVTEEDAELDYEAGDREYKVIERAFVITPAGSVSCILVVN